MSANTIDTEKSNGGVNARGLQCCIAALRKAIHDTSHKSKMLLNLTIQVRRGYCRRERMLEGSSTLCLCNASFLFCCLRSDRLHCFLCCPSAAPPLCSQGPAMSSCTALYRLLPRDLLWAEGSPLRRYAVSLPRDLTNSHSAQA
jgi:hypothetical protein